MTNVIETKALQKVYGGAEKPAVTDLNLSVSQGEIFGLLGPNGAGKTTTVLLLATLTRPTQGEAWVCGYSILTEPDRIRACIGYCPQEISVDEELTAWENMMLYARLSGLAADEARRRVRDLFETISLTGRERELVRHYSSGMRRRLEVMGALIHQPQLLFLDEPTLGLDPPFRREMWHRVRQARDEGSSVLLTTHYLEEAEALCDRVAIISQGQIRVVGSPNCLKAEIGQVLHLSLVDPGQEALALEQLQAMGGVEEFISGPDGIHIFTTQGEQIIAPLVSLLREAGVEVQSLTFSRASLDDVFLRHTGQRMVDNTV